jgi:hypothetical protein
MLIFGDEIVSLLKQIAPAVIAIGKPNRDHYFLRLRLRHSSFSCAREPHICRVGGKENVRFANAYHINERAINCLIRSFTFLLPQ